MYTKCWTQRVSIDVSLSAYSASTVAAPIDLFCVAPLYFWSGRFFLLVCSVCAPHFSSCSQRFKNYALFGNSCTPLCLAELLLFWHSFSFKQLANRRISFSRPLVWHSLKFIIFRLNFRYILPCLTVPNYAFCLNNAVQVEEFQLWLAQTYRVKAPYCNEGLL